MLLLFGETAYDPRRASLCGVKWTAIAAACPRKLADFMVQTLLAPSRLACASHLEKSLFYSPPTATL
eukprot:2827942-Pyramimonas_sp.AAC.1